MRPKPLMPIFVIVVSEINAAETVSGGRSIR
jgi:hypothetical protein